LEAYPQSQWRAAAKRIIGGMSALHEEHHRKVTLVERFREAKLLAG
jgi:hypothetical protein